VVSCSLEAFWFCYSILKSPEKKSKKNIQQKKRNKKRGKKKQEDNTEGALCVCFLFFCAVVLCDYLGVQAPVSSTV
jgi:hypothetical protein